MKVAETHVSVHSSHHSPLDVSSGGFFSPFFPGFLGAVKIQTNNYCLTNRLISLLDPITTITESLGKGW